MPLYEAAAYSAEKSAVVFDIGAAYSKCGFAGELAPRYIIQSEVKNPQTGQVKKVYEYSDADELYELLKDFLNKLYFRYLLCNSKDRRVVICESVLCPTVFRETLAKVLFNHYEVPSVFFGSSHQLALLTLGASCGLVLDVGYTESCAIPIYEGIPILNAYQAYPLGGKAIHSQLKNLLLEHATVMTGEHGGISMKMFSESLTEELLENIKVTCCFITKLSRAKQILGVHGKSDSNKLPVPPPDVEYPLNGSEIFCINGMIREAACEVLFEQDNEQKSVATLILDAIAMCPIDVRVKMAENIVIMGGTAMLPGFYPRLQAELYDLVNSSHYQELLSIKTFKFHQPPAKENCTSWLGGAIVGATEALTSRSISSETFSLCNQLPDWCVIKDRRE